MRYNLHTHRTPPPGEAGIVNCYPDEMRPDTWFSIGIHPWRIDLARMNSDLDAMEIEMQNENCLAIGECGLDKRIETPLSEQITAFESQLALAQHHGKPVIIHCVAAFDEVMAILKTMKISIPVIFHGFSKSAELAQQLVSRGYYLSFGKYLLRNPELSFVLKGIPGNQYFLETDTIEESLEAVYARAATARGLSVEEIEKEVKENFLEVFKCN